MFPLSWADHFWKVKKLMNWPPNGNVFVNIQLNTDLDIMMLWMGSDETGMAQKKGNLRLATTK